MSDFNLGTVTAYGYAKDKGYTGTEDEFAALMASYADVAEQAAESANQAAASATTASTKASEAAASATAAASSKTAAETAQGGAETAATTATTKAGEASASATTASGKATEATTAAGTATTKASEATTAATTATTKAGEASTSATNAAASATRAQEILDSIPSDYSQLSDDVEDLKDGLSDVEAQVTAALVTDTAIGSIASFSDGADGVPVKSLTVDIEPAQSGSGDPSPSNVRPISGWTQAKVTRCGKNLLNNVNPDVKNAYIGNIGGYYRLVSNPNNKSVIMSVKPNTTYTYTFNRVAITSSTDDSNVIMFDEYPVLGETIGTLTGDLMYDGDVRTFTTTATTKYIGIKIVNVNNTDFDGTLSASQLEIGSTSSTHEPYTADTYTIDLDGTRYGGSLDVGTGVLTVDRGYVVYDGSSDEAWTRYSSGSASAFAMQIVVDNLKFIHGVVNIKTNYLNPIDNNQTWGNYENFASVNSNNRIVTGVKTITTIDAWESYLATNPLQLVYELTSPFTVQLTANEISTLLGQNNIWNDCGNTEVEYRADTKLYINKVLNA